MRGRSSSRSVWPTARGSRRNARSQSASLISTPSASEASSSERNVRPSTGVTPSIGSSRDVTASAAARVGSAPSGVSVTSVGTRASRRSSRRLRCRKSWRSGQEAGSWLVPLERSVSHTITSRCGSGNGTGRMSTASTTLKIAVVMPMPSASVTRLAMVNAGHRASMRAAWRRSCHRSRVIEEPPGSGGGGASGRRRSLARSRSARLSSARSSARMVASASAAVSPRRRRSSQRSHRCCASSSTTSASRAGSPVPSPRHARMCGRQSTGGSYAGLMRATRSSASTNSCQSDRCFASTRRPSGVRR